MDAFLPGWSPELERSFKEILFRFLEHVHCTKAALYLLSPDGSYQLATQYGFGRRDLLTVRFESSAPVVRKARDLRVKPLAVNHRDEFPEHSETLSGAGSTRMLLVPVYGGSRLAGFVDARDKGKKRPFEASDISTAGNIAKEMLKLVCASGIVADIEDDEPESKAVSKPAPVVVPKPAATNIPVLDEVGLERLTRDLPMILDGEPEVVAIVVTVVSGKAIGTRLVTTHECGRDEYEPALFHQAEALRAEQITPPPPAEWDVRIVHRSRSTGSGRSVAATQGVATSVVLRDGSWGLVISVVGGAENGGTEKVLARLQRLAHEVSAEVQLRYARRRLVNNLLNPQGDRYRALEQHSHAVAKYAWMTAMELGLGPTIAEEAAVVGLLHDVGMRELDYDMTYRHPSPGPAERRAFRRHPELGERIADEVGLGDLARAVRSHHERWDGKGYPDGLSGSGIPLVARIVHAAEVLDVLTSDQSYRNAVTEDRATAILKAEAGKQFDPDVVDALLRVL